MNDYEQVQEMKARMADLKAKTEAAMMAATFFFCFLYDQGDSESEAVAREVAKVNREIGDCYDRLFDLEARLY